MLADYLSRSEEVQHSIFAIGSSSRPLDHADGESSIWQHLLDELKG